MKDIYLHGRSIFMQAIEAGLYQRGDVRVSQFDPQQQRMLGEHPFLFIMESGAGTLNLNWLLEDVPLLVIDVLSGKGRLLRSQSCPVNETDELERLVEELLAVSA